MCVSSARERSFEDRFAWLIRGEVGKKSILKKNGVLPARDASSFWLKKKGGPNVVGMRRPTGPLIGKGLPQPIF